MFHRFASTCSEDWRDYALHYKGVLQTEIPEIHIQTNIHLGETQTGPYKCEEEQDEVG